MRHQFSPSHHSGLEELGIIYYSGDQDVEGPSAQRFSINNSTIETKKFASGFALFCPRPKGTEKLSSWFYISAERTLGERNFWWLRPPFTLVSLLTSRHCSQTRR